eukprot:GEMP01054142.1.p1 GENE.GEMP01054142.1~~GEMP01054142.1.p1  ORF type:complete len:220 (+),score=27.63 GEMP01054142.1:86-661(+)
MKLFFLLSTIVALARGKDFLLITDEEVHALAERGFDTCVEDLRQECQACNSPELDCAWFRKVLCISCAQVEKFEQLRHMCNSTLHDTFSVHWNGTAHANEANAKAAEGLLEEHFITTACNVNEFDGVILFLAFATVALLASAQSLIRQRGGETNVQFSKLTANMPQPKIPNIFKHTEMELPTVFRQNEKRI